MTLFFFFLFFSADPRGLSHWRTIAKFEKITLIMISDGSGEYEYWMGSQGYRRGKRVKDTIELNSWRSPAFCSMVVGVYQSIQDQTNMSQQLLITYDRNQLR